MSWERSSGSFWTRLMRLLLSATKPRTWSSSLCFSAMASWTSFAAFWASPTGKREASDVTVPFLGSSILPLLLFCYCHTHFTLPYVSAGASNNSEVTAFFRLRRWSCIGWFYLWIFFDKFLKTLLMKTIFFFFLRNFRKLKLVPHYPNKNISWMFFASDKLAHVEKKRTQYAVFFLPISNDG